VSAIAAVAERDFLSAAGPEDFARAVLLLLSDAQRSREVGLAGRAFVETSHSWDVIAGRLVDVYRGVVS
jgi:glycosyltransferase involved in cell wall biosynthesis